MASTLSAQSMSVCHILTRQVQWLVVQIKTVEDNRQTAVDRCELVSQRQRFLYDYSLDDIIWRNMDSTVSNTVIIANAGLSTSLDLVAVYELSRRRWQSFTYVPVCLFLPEYFVFFVLLIWTKTAP